MAYTKQTWADGEEGNTPITAARLNHIEDGVSAADTVTWAEVTGKPTTFAPVVGTGATDAKAGNYVPAWADVTGKPSTFAPPAATASVVGGVKQAAAQANSAATDVAGLLADFNSLLAKLRTAGVLAT